MGVHFIRKEINVLVHLPDEYWVQREHYKVHEPRGVNVVHIQKQLWTPGGEKLAHSQEVNWGLEVRFGFAEGLSRVVVF